MRARSGEKIIFGTNIYDAICKIDEHTKFEVTKSDGSKYYINCNGEIVDKDS